VGEERQGEGGFLPAQFFGAGPTPGADDRRAQLERKRERQLAAQVNRRREHGGRPAPRARTLSRADIVAAAVAVADAEGTDAVSMRRIARDLQVGAMSLYWHVESREELHRLMIEAVQAEIEATEPSGDWRADLTAYARNTREALHRHRWAIDYLGAGPPTGPNDARNADRLIGSIEGLGLDLTSTMWVLMTLGTYVTGSTLREIQEIRWEQTQAEVTDQMTEGEVTAAFEEFERRVLGSGLYPNIARVFNANFDPDAPESRDARFEFGLDLVLDGIAARAKR
jgi:AcrR family transcriptional regulator